MHFLLLFETQFGPHRRSSSKKLGQKVPASRHFAEVVCYTETKSSQSRGVGCQKLDRVMSPKFICFPLGLRLHSLLALQSLAELNPRNCLSQRRLELPQV
eukprot:2330169-Amphidinium_carterae.1